MNKKQGKSNTYNYLEEVVFRVHQGSPLGPILFNISLSDIFLVFEESD